MLDAVPCPTAHDCQQGVLVVALAYYVDGATPRQGGHRRQWRGRQRCRGRTGGGRVAGIGGGGGKGAGGARIALGGARGAPVGGASSEAGSALLRHRSRSPTEVNVGAAFRAGWRRSSSDRQSAAQEAEKARCVHWTWVFELRTHVRDLRLLPLDRARRRRTIALWAFRVVATSVDGSTSGRPLARVP